MWLNVEEKENTFLTPKPLDLRELSVIRTQQMINPYNTRGTGGHLQISVIIFFISVQMILKRPSE